ncbi:MAG: molybdenum cofactor guanylyltransferase [Terracidiphilus sp.]
MSPARRSHEAARRNEDAAGFVLAGGQSSRMGIDKALVEFSGQPLVVHALSILRKAGLPASIAGAQAELGSFAPVIPDASPGQGPLGGICAALAATSARHAVFVSVDAPFVPPSLLEYLLYHARVTGSPVSIASVNGFDQTFPAVIDRAALPALQAELLAGRLGAFSAFQAAAASLGQPVGRVLAEFLAQAGQVLSANGLPPVRWFLNLNTSADLKRAAALAARRIG